MERIDSKRICEVEGCGCLGDIVRISKDGKVYRRKWCTKHRKKYYRIKQKNRPSSVDKLKRSLIKSGTLLKCSICGWDKARCDMHRKINGKDGGRYTRNNIISLCPNCHRLVHLGLLTI